MVAWRACLLVLVVGSKTLPAAISMIGENSEGIPPSCESKFPPTSVKENKKSTTCMGVARFASMSCKLKLAVFFRMFCIFCKDQWDPDFHVLSHSV